MIKTVSVALFFLLCSSISEAQENHTIREITNYEGRVLPYISEQAFRDMKIDGVFPLDRVINTDSLTELVEQLGEPLEIAETADTASTSQVIFEYRDVKYSGMTIHYEKYDIFLPTTITVTSERHFLELAGERIQVGRTPGQISTILGSAADSTESDSFRLWVFQGDSKGNVQQDEDGYIAGGARFITFRIDPVSGQISEITIVLRPV